MTTQRRRQLERLRKIRGAEIMLRHLITRFHVDKCQNTNGPLADLKRLAYLVRLARRVDRLEAQLYEAHRALKAMGAKGYLVPTRLAKRRTG